MKREGRIKIVEEGKSLRFELNHKNELIYMKTNLKVENLSILIDFGIKEDKTPCALKYGEYDKLLPYLKDYSNNKIFNVQIIKIPNKMHRWVDIIFDISASNWANYLKEELKFQGKKYE